MCRVGHELREGLQARPHFVFSGIPFLCNPRLKQSSRGSDTCFTPLPSCSLQNRWPRAQSSQCWLLQAAPWARAAPAGTGLRGEGGKPIARATAPTGSAQQRTPVRLSAEGQSSSSSPSGAAPHLQYVPRAGRISGSGWEEPPSPGTNSCLFYVLGA